VGGLQLEYNYFVMQPTSNKMCSVERLHFSIDCGNEFIVIK
jgi:hypothetical protein